MTDTRRDSYGQSYDSDGIKSRGEREGEMRGKSPIKSILELFFAYAFSSFFHNFEIYVSYDISRV